MAILSGCIGVGPPPADTGPVQVGPLSPPFPRPDGDGPPIECRALSRDRCGDIGSIADGEAGVALEDVEWVIVSCTGSCTSNAGEFRIDVVVEEETREIGRGGYGAAQ